MMHLLIEFVVALVSSAALGFGLLRLASLPSLRRRLRRLRRRPPVLLAPWDDDPPDSPTPH